MTNVQKIGRPPVHGKSRTIEYFAWKAIKARCNNPKSQYYHLYGARGIKIYEPWNKSFNSFIEYVGLRPSDKHSIDRINNDGNYEPGNVEWRTQKAQSNNRRSNKIIVYQGESLTMSQWCDKLNLSYAMVSKRITKYKWPVEKALTQPAEIHIRR